MADDWGEVDTGDWGSKVSTVVHHSPAVKKGEKPGSKNKFKLVKENTPTGQPVQTVKTEKVTRKRKNKKVNPTQTERRKAKQPKIEPTKDIETNVEEPEEEARLTL